jgi:lipopolysaccharide biosynthesis glycosyltransferase
MRESDAPEPSGSRAETAARGPEPLVLACAADGPYAMPLAVMLRSVDARLAPELQLEVYVIDDGLAAGDRERIERPLSPRARLHWRQPERSALGGLPTWGRMATTTYEKLTLPRWLPDSHPRAIWIDCDALVLVDLAPLAQLELGEAPLAAVRDPLVPEVSSRLGVAGWRALGLAADAPYFNAGVLVLDLERFRRERIAERAIEHLERRHREVAFWDQEALNVAVAGRWRELEPRWNWNPILSPWRAPARAGGARDVALAHFSGRLKPWLYPGLGPLQEAWFDALDTTAWAGRRPLPSAGRALASRYARWRGRRRLLGIEQWATTLHRALTRRRVGGDGT